MRFGLLPFRAKPTFQGLEFLSFGPAGPTLPHERRSSKRSVETDRVRHFQPVLRRKAPPSSRCDVGDRPSSSSAQKRHTASLRLCALDSLVAIEAYEHRERASSFREDDGTPPTGNRARDRSQLGSSLLDPHVALFPRHVKETLGLSRHHPYS